MTSSIRRRTPLTFAIIFIVGSAWCGSLDAQARAPKGAGAQKAGGDVEVNFGGDKAPLPRVDPSLANANKNGDRGPIPRTPPPSEKPAGGGDGNLAEALESWFNQPDGADGGKGGAAAPGGEAAAGPDGEALEEGDDKSIFKKFVNLLQEQGSELHGEGIEDESTRKIKELERFAERNFEKDRYAETKKNVNDLITLKPYEPGYHFALGLAFRKETRHEESLKKYQDVLDLGGPKPLVHLLMAESYAERGDKGKSFDHLREAAVGGRNIIHDVASLSILQQYMADTEFIKLALSLEKYDIETKKRQDPMTNPPESSGQGDENLPPGTIVEPDDKDKLLTAEEQQRLLSDARKAYDRVQWYIKLEDEEKAMENYIQLRALLENRDRLTIPKISNDFRQLVARMEGLEAQIEGIRLKFYYNQALAQLRLMKEHFQEAEYNQVKLVFEEVKKLALEMERTNARYKPVAERVLEAGKVWITRTEIREEFETNKPTIQGIIIANEQNKAIINNRIYRQGEEFNAILVQKVENNRVTFRYKGEEIPLVFRRY